MRRDIEGLEVEDVPAAGQRRRRRAGGRPRAVHPAAAARPRSRRRRRRPRRREEPTPTPSRRRRRRPDAAAADRLVQPPRLPVDPRTPAARPARPARRRQRQRRRRRRRPSGSGTGDRRRGGDDPPGSDDRVHPTLDDPVVTALSEGVGGPVGERAGRHRWWTPVRVVLALTALCFALGMVQKASCYDADLAERRRRLLPHVLLRPALPLHRPRLRRAELALHRRRAGARPLRGDGVPRRHLLLRLGRRLGHPLAERVARHLAALRAGRGRARPPTRRCRRRSGTSSIVNAVGFAVAALLAAWLLERRESAAALGRGALRAVPGPAR